MTAKKTEFSFVEGQIRLQTDEIEEELSCFGFARVHQSFLVNMRYIEKLSSYVLWLINGKEISVPKSRYQEVKRKRRNLVDNAVKDIFQI